MSNKQLNSNSLVAQRARLKKYLEEHQRLTTLKARSELDVMHPAGRIQELRESGLDIITHWRTDHTPEGKPHRVAEYVLMTGERKTPAATEVNQGYAGNIGGHSNES